MAPRAEARGAPEAMAGALRVTREGERCRIEGTLDFDTAREALESLAPALASGEVRTVDLSGVTRSNSAALALLVEWRALARRAGYALAFAGIPEGIRQLARVCEVEGLIGEAE